MSLKKKALESFFGTKVQKLLIGRSTACVKQNATKVVVKSLELDNHVVMYFNRNDVYYAYDPHKLCKEGDIVLIKELEKKKSILITHELIKVIYPLGDMTCPLSGRKSLNIHYYTPIYRDVVDEINKIYGENEGRFKYDEAPPRGWQEDKRDLSHKESYIKYHETGEEEPYAYP